MKFAAFEESAALYGSGHLATWYKLPGVLSMAGKLKEVYHQHCCNTFITKHIMSLQC